MMLQFISRKPGPIIFVSAALIGLMPLYIKGFFLNSTGLYILDKVLERLSLFDLVFPFVFLVNFPRFILPILKRRVIVVPAVIYSAVICLLAVLHHHPLDVYYWIAQLYGVTIYLFFCGAGARMDKRSLRLFGEMVFESFLLSVLAACIIAIFLGENILWAGDFYSTFLPIFRYRLQLLGDPDRLGNYFFFISFCVSLCLLLYRDKEKRNSYWIAATLIIAALAVRGRIMPFIFIFALSPLYLNATGKQERRALLSAVIASALLLAVGMFSTVVALFPVKTTPPYLNVNTPSQYFVLHNTYARIFLNENMLVGSGYARSNMLYPKYVDEKLENDALSSYHWPKKTVEEWVGRPKPPHNVYLRILSSGGIIWLLAWIILSVAPIIIHARKANTEITLAVLVIGFFIANFLVGYFEETIHYVWYWAGLGLVHGIIVPVVSNGEYSTDKIS